MKAVVTLSPEESKRLIAKAIVDMDVVQKAKKNGIIGLARCSSAAFVVEELTGRPLANRAAYLSGYMNELGACALGAERQEKLLVLEKGKEHWMTFKDGNVANFTDRMTPDDVIIKSGNVIDRDGKVGCLVASPTGGEIGAYMPPILVRGITFLVPMTLNKTLPVSLDKVMGALGAGNIHPERCHGLRCGMMPMPGQVITEVDAVRQLTGAEALPVSVGGIGSGAGALMLAIDGEESKVEAAWNLISGIRATGEPPLESPAYNCDDCYIFEHPGLGNRCSTLTPAGCECA